MTQPIPDKAEIAVDFPDKLYTASFERTARFRVHLDKIGVSLTLFGTNPADARKSVHIHLHYALFSEILHNLAKIISAFPPEQTAHHDLLRDAVKTLYLSLITNRGDDVSTLTPEEEVLLLHILE
jgi:hypothetical protein